MARRCGERDASSNGAVGGASAIALARDPDLFRRPLLRPLDGDVRVVLVRPRVGPRIQLDQALDIEAALARQVDQLAVRQMELDLLRVFPLQAMQIALWFTDDELV